VARVIFSEQTRTAWEDESSKSVRNSQSHKNAFWGACRQVSVPIITTPTKNSQTLDGLQWVPPVRMGWSMA